MAQEQPRPYPVTLTASLQQPVSRWLFLVKWLLLIPHYLALIVLSIAWVVAWLAALVAILVTGKYPRGLFDFNVGVLRWAWRVAYYGYNALGTDAYPPFTLDKRAGYPADVDVAYPAKLSRGLALVKWWLLALPHLLVVSILNGGVGPRSGSGLIGILVLVAAVINLFTGKYPADLYRLIMGLNRWTFRVAGYVMLFTDDYPPFRLDLEG
ncbi:MAG: DUF4389 domain-containing protein [Chloroflexi bacterium]|nr:DUF4389 domain-containing protein [Chloroflexota bacterium]